MNNSPSRLARLAILLLAGIVALVFLTKVLPRFLALAEGLISTLTTFVIVILAVIGLVSFLRWRLK